MTSPENSDSINNLDSPTIQGEVSNTPTKKVSRLSKLFSHEKTSDSQDADNNEIKDVITSSSEMPEQALTANLEHTELDARDVAQPLNNDSSVEQGLAPTRDGLMNKISNVFKRSFNLDDELFDDLEDSLISSDIGIEASLKLVDQLRDRVKSEKIRDANGVMAGLRSEVSEMLKVAEQPWIMDKKPYVIIMVGVNGVGKTTTTAKIAHYLKRHDKTVMLAAADTFRAAAVEQLQEWGQRLDMTVITQGHGADAAAVAHDAMTSAKARDVDVLIIDTAGRLHTQSDLMEQLVKINRVLQKIEPNTPHEVIQVLDAGTGQNALAQLKHFQEAVGVSSLCLTKLDGSAKGGVAIALSEKYKLPIRFIGVGESFADLKVFNAKEFADALVPASVDLI
ncbi:MAG: fused signal recognition particle receptor [Dinoroseobacter sp.]|jgi:fused signal recognition particle receptor